MVRSVWTAAGQTEQPASPHRKDALEALPGGPAWGPYLGALSGDLRLPRNELLISLMADGAGLRKPRPPVTGTLPAKAVFPPAKVFRPPRCSAARGRRSGERAGAAWAGRGCRRQVPLRDDSFHNCPPP